MLMILGIGINAVAVTLFSVPIVGYIFAPARKREMSADLEWVSLGQITQFPEGETRLATYRNPLVRPSDGDTANIRVAARGQNLRSEPAAGARRSEVPTV